MSCCWTAKPQPVGTHRWASGTDTVAEGALGIITLAQVAWGWGAGCHLPEGVTLHPAP